MKDDANDEDPKFQYKRWWNTACHLCLSFKCSCLFIPNAFFQCFNIIINLIWMAFITS
jgi:hypothetical protein